MKHGLRRATGSWKIIAISLPDQLAALGAASWRSRSRPSKRHRVGGDRGGIGGSRPITASIDTDLPDPNSPTMASTSPRVDREVDAVDRGEGPGGGVEGDGQVLDLEQRHRSAPLQLGVERVAQAVADQVDGEHGDQDGEARARSPPTRRRRMNSRASASIVPHSGVGGCAPMPRKPSAAASRMALEKRQRRLHDQRRQAVGQDGHEHQPQLAGAGDPGGGDVLAVPSRAITAARVSRAKCGCRRWRWRSWR